MSEGYLGTKVCAAFVAAQAEMPSVAKDGKNPHFNSRFASLDAIVETIKPVLAKHDLAITQSATCSDDGKFMTVQTRLVHLSGEFLVSTVVVPVAKLDPQGAGATLTYCRRFGLSTLLSLAADDDDDGNAASAPRKAQRAPQAQVPANPLMMPFGKHKGQPVAGMSGEDLTSLRKWINDPLNPKRAVDFKALSDYALTILTDRSLGQDDDSAVKNMVEAEDQFSSELPFVVKR